MDKTIETWTVSPSLDGARLDLFLTEASSLSRSQVKRLVEGGRVSIDGVVAPKVSRKLKACETVVLNRPPVAVMEALPEDIPLSILYEDAHLLVLDKPAGLVVHPAPGHAGGTLVNAVLRHCRDLSGIGGVLRPGIVHRLDKDTSGVLVFAKSDTAHAGLVNRFKRREIGKTYLALVWGAPRENAGRIDLPVGRHPRERQRMSVRGRRGKPAVTHWRVVRRYGAVSLLEVALETGRTHQIRVHLNAIGHPVVGDPVYGGAGRVRGVADPVLRFRLQAMKRQALHAARLDFVHPVTGMPLSVSAPLPPDMAELTAFLEKDAGGAAPDLGNGAPRPGGAR
jgi:23S rRNA pseudouridine1911/1915/1917 synthase